MEVSRGGSSQASFCNAGRTAPPAVSLSVQTTPEADAQIREIDEWWRTNRPAAPDLFLHELNASFDIIGQAPHIGRLYRGSPVPRARRLLLKGTRYHVYYARALKT